MQIGDIFLVSVPRIKLSGRTVDSLAERNPADMVLLYLGNDPKVLKQAEAHLKRRLVFQRTGTKKGSGSGETAEKQDDLFDGALGTRRDRVISTLPVVAFPQITADAGQGVGLGIVRALAALGLAGASRTTVSLDFSDVRSLRAPDAEVIVNSRKVALGMFKKVTSHIESKRNLRNKFFSELAALAEGNRLRLGNGNTEIETDFGNRCYRLVVITEVYLARRIDFTYSNGRIVAAGIQNASRSSLPSQANQLQPINPVIVQMNPPAASDGSNSPQNIVTSQDVQSVQQQAIDLINKTEQGDSLTFQSWDALGVRFSRTYDRPVTIGWRGVDYQAPNSLYIPDGEETREQLHERMKNECIM